MLEDLIKEREEKLKKYGSVRSPYPARVKREVELGKVLEDFPKLEKWKKSFFTAGRVLSWRDQGKIVFADLDDGTGRIQLVLNENNFKDLKFAKETADVGDFV